MLRIALTLATVLLTLPSPAHADITGKPRIIDGDTLEIAGERIRLHGIDAPEARQTCTEQSGKEWNCGQEATWALARIIETHWVRCEGNKRDKYGRLIAKCFTGPYDIEAKMVQQGWALAYRKYSTDYVAEEAEAKAQKLGLWRGQFVAPWDWRRGERLASEAQKSCCKLCRKGKACGNSCIRRTYTCRKQPGCACDAN